MPHKVLYEELTPREFLARLEKTPIAYLPLGTLEWHGAHLPLGSDGLQSQGFFGELAKRVGGIVLPMLFLGPDRYKVVDGKPLYGMDICKQKFGTYPDQQLPGSAYWVGQNFFTQLLGHVLKRLRRAGFRIVVAHGHGPSTNLFAKSIPKWSRELDLRLFHCWRDDESDGLGIQTDHAGANETSLVMALRPDLVQMENLPTDPGEFPLALGPLDPRIHASPELGRKAIEMQLERMERVLRQALAEVGG